MTVRLALMRHGHTAWNRERRLQGRSDIPLDDKARRDLAEQSLPAPWGAATLWSSPLSRASQTAQLVASRAPRTDPALTEMNWGLWEGQRGADLRADPASGFRDIEDWGWDYRPPSGESPREVLARLGSWRDGLVGANVAVCHIGIMRVLLASAYGWGFSGPCPFKIKRNRLYLMHCDNEVWQADPVPLPLLMRAT